MIPLFETVKYNLKDALKCEDLKDYYLKETMSRKDVFEFSGRRDSSPSEFIESIHLDNIKEDE